MHLALVISSLQSGGAERVLSDLANHWVAEGHRVSLVTLAPKGAQPFYSLNPKIHLVQLDQSQTAGSFTARLGHIVRRVFCLRKTLQTLQPDVILSFVDVMNTTTLLASAGLKIPVIVSERTDPHHHVLPPLYRWLRLKIYPWAAQLVVQTPAAAAYFPGSFRRLVAIIPNAVQRPQHLKTDYAPKAQQIITVGRLSAEKGQATLIQAFAAAQRRYPDLQLTIYGEGPERPALEALIRDLKLEGHVHLRGAIRHIPEVLVAADLFVFPSRYEGFPNALCEAMAVGLPVVASACSGNRDVVTDEVDGRLFPVGDGAALTDILLELITDHVKRQRLGENAQKVSERFSPERIYGMWDDVVEGKRL